MKTNEDLRRTMAPLAGALISGLIATAMGCAGAGVTPLPADRVKAFYVRQGCSRSALGSFSRYA